MGAERDNIAFGLTNNGGFVFAGKQEMLITSNLLIIIEGR